MHKLKEIMIGFFSIVESACVIPIALVSKCLLVFFYIPYIKYCLRRFKKCKIEKDNNSRPFIPVFCRGIE